MFLRLFDCPTSDRSNNRENLAITITIIPLRSGHFGKMRSLSGSDPEVFSGQGLGAEINIIIQLSLNRFRSVRFDVAARRTFLGAVGRLFSRDP